MTMLRNLFSYHVHEPHSNNNEYKNMCVLCHAYNNVIPFQVG